MNISPSRRSLVRLAVLLAAFAWTFPSRGAELAQILVEAEDGFQPITGDRLAAWRQAAASALDKLTTRPTTEPPRPEWVAPLVAEHQARLAAPSEPAEALTFWRSARPALAEWHLQERDPEVASAVFVYRQSVDALIEALACSTDAKAKDAYTSKIDELKTLCQADLHQLTRPQQQRLVALTNEFAKTRQAASLVTAIRSEFAHPNLVIRVPRSSLRNLKPQRIESPFNINQYINGALVRGNGTLTADQSIALAQTDHKLAFSLAFSGNTSSHATSCRDGVTVRTRDNASFTSSSLITFDGLDFHASPVQTSAHLNTQVLSVAGGGRFLGIRQRRAEQAVYANLESNRQAAERSTIRDLNANFGSRIEEAVASLRQEYQSRVAGPMRRAGVWPTKSRTRTGHGISMVELRLAAPEQLAAPRAFSPPSSQGLLQVGVHESSLNNYTAIWANGERNLATALQSLLAGPQPPEQDPDAVTITFADAAPVSFEFEGGAIRIRMRGKQFEQRGRRLPGMELVLKYQIDSSTAGVRFVAQPPEVLAPLNAEGKRARLGVRGVAVRRVLQNALAKYAPKELDAASLFPSPSKQPIKVMEATASDCWLALNLEATPADGE